MKKRSQTKERTEKKRWNAFDYILLFLLLLSLTGILFRVYALRSPGGAEPVTVTARFLSDVLLTEVAEAAEKEAALSLHGNLYEVVTLARQGVPLEGEVGAASPVYSEERTRLALTLTLSGHMTAGGFFLNGKTYFVPGTRVALSGEHSFFEATLTELDFSA